MVNSPTDGLSDEERLLRQAIDDAFVTTGTTIVPVCAATTPLVATHMRSLPIATLPNAMMLVSSKTVST